MFNDLVMRFLRDTPLDWILQNINGVSTWTYDANIKTVAQATTADYQNVTAIYSFAKISGEGFMGTGNIVIL